MALISLAIGVVIIPAAVLLATAAGERVLSRLDRPLAERLRPWFWLAPVILLVGAIIAYPTCATIWLSFHGNQGRHWAGLTNFAWATSSATLPILFNNLLWVILMPLWIVACATAMAVLIDRVKYEVVARTLLVLPTAVSLTAAGISWQMLYAWSPAGRTQLGLFNAILQSIHFNPIAWTARPPSGGQWLNSVALIAVGTWSGLGIGVLIMSAAVKAVPKEMVEAGRIDGAGEWRIFWRVILREIWPSVLTVITTQIMAALKVFDVVYVMTNGNSGTQVIANKLVAQLFDYPPRIGRASALAVLLMLCALPVVWYNVRSIKTESAA